MSSPDVIARLARKGIAPAPEAVGQPTARWPDRRRRTRERVTAVDVGLDDLQPALEIVEQVAQRPERVFRGRAARDVKSGVCGPPRRA